jgi:nicotinamide-nucleotide amidase
MSVNDQQLAEAADALGDLLLQRKCMLVTAESCTGGWVAKVLTDRPGSSAYVLGGLVTYSNEAKQKVLGVAEKTLEVHGAVSAPVVEEMVAGALARTGADVAVAISGVAGPGGGSEHKPVGTVWFAWGDSGRIEASLQHFQGDRDAVRRQAVGFALRAVERFLKSR